MTINVDTSGKTFTFDYYFNGGCVEKTVTMVKSNPLDSWYTVTVSRSSISLTVTANSGSSPRSAYITPKLDGTVSCPNSRIYISQQSSKVCACADLVIDLFAIPQSGITSGGKIGEYTYDCADSELSGQIKYNGTVVSTVSFSNGNILVDTTIGANTGDSFKEFVFEAECKSQLCSTYNLSQEGENVKCDCESISYYVNQLHTKFSLSGSYDTEILIASADTHGCGSLSATVGTNTVFKNDTIREVVEDNGHSYYWYATINSAETTSTSAINIYFKNRDESSFNPNCYFNFSVECRSGNVFYTCNLINQTSSKLPKLIYTEKIYNDLNCIPAGDFYITASSVQMGTGATNTKVAFVPRLITTITQSYLSSTVTKYSSVPYDDSNVTLATGFVTGRYSSSSPIFSRTPIINVGYSTTPRKFYFAVDVYVNDIFCFTREGIFVANIDEATITKCDLIYNHMLQMYSGISSYSCDSYFEDWAGSDSYSSSRVCVNWEICTGSKYCYRTEVTPEVFEYSSSTGEDVVGSSNWQEIPFEEILGSYDYQYMLTHYHRNTYESRITSSVNTCTQGWGASFDTGLTPTVRIIDTGTTLTRWEFEKDGSGNYTNRVRLVNGNTASTYVKDTLGFYMIEDGYFTFADEDEDFVCVDSDHPFQIKLYLRAIRKETHVDNLDYTSCSTLASNLRAYTNYLYLDSTAREAWEANGYITSITYNYTIPHSQVQIENEDDGTIETLNLYWDDSNLDARVFRSYNKNTGELKAYLNYDTSTIHYAIDDANLCALCEEKSFALIIPSSLAVTSYTITADTVLTCSVSITPSDYNSSTRYGCDNRRTCYDQPISFTITTAQTYDFSTYLSQGVDIGTFTPLSDTTNYKIQPSFDGGTPISAFTINYTTGVIHMVLNSNYHAPSTETTRMVSVVFNYMMKDCDGNWVGCDSYSSPTIEITLTDIQT